MHTGAGDDVVHLAGWTNLVTLGGGNNTVFLGSGGNTIVLSAEGADQIENFNLANNDVLDLRDALAQTLWNGDTANLGNYLQVSSAADDTTIALNASGTTGQAAVTLAVLHGAGNFSLADLIGHNALRLT